MRYHTPRRLPTFRVGHLLHLAGPFARASPSNIPSPPSWRRDFLGYAPGVLTYEVASSRRKEQLVDKPGKPKII